ncbi:MAG: putative transmembrane protein [bacterium]|nr:MAG: putative transmembrane protein [bacterium]KAF0149096.1 MAG: putative transmembrane protein [bacterium]KAF0168412.1 MAG: putative transmembrane protein [bacterium]TXT20379.1 MAG: putative transmembrane protein [bacterium]
MTSLDADPGAAVPGVPRRLASALYDAFLLTAVCLLAALPLAALGTSLPREAMIVLLRVYVFLVAGFYFALFWHKGQTLAMKTWRIRIESASGGPPTWRQAWTRFLFAGLNLLLLGIGWWAAWFTRDRQFLQDRLAGTRLLRT